MTPFLDFLVRDNTSVRADGPPISMEPALSDNRTYAELPLRHTAAGRTSIHSAPNEVRMQFSTANRPTQQELDEFESQYMNSIYPRTLNVEPRRSTVYEPMDNSYRTVVSGNPISSFEGPPKQVQITKITAEQILREMPSCLYGSRGLGLENADDYDIALSIEDPKYLRFVQYLENMNVYKVDIKKYANSTPESGYYGLYRFLDAEEKHIDLLVLYLDEDLDVIRSTITDMRRIPPYFLDIKTQRIKMYNQGLRYRGWKEGVKTRLEYAEKIAQRNASTYRARGQSTSITRDNPYGIRNTDSAFDSWRSAARW